MNGGRQSRMRRRERRRFLRLKEYERRAEYRAKAWKATGISPYREEFGIVAALLVITAVLFIKII